MKNLNWLLVIVILLQVACQNSPLKLSKEQRHNIQKSLKQQKELLAGRKDELFSVIDESKTSEEKMAMEFLFAYMPLNDMIDYDGKFFQENVRMALKAREEMSWGKSIPKEIFYHFVLPYRVSNENLDTFRIAVYDEIKARVQNLSMEEAAKEVNHWCSEKVTYKGTSSRTTAALSLMRTSYGRCGEEAAFTVNAMRTAGIPARQCYTPRWAHSDDNHAWVEVWIDGKWSFLGACEPAPELNMGWFAAPATRAMLINSVTYGDYTGNETVNSNDGKKTTLNITTNYAPVKKVTVTIVNEKLQAIENAKVYFKIFNYGELSTLADKTTDKNGQVTMTSGLGDYLVWATDSIKFGFKNITVDKVDSVTIILKDTPQTAHNVQFDIVPPVPGNPLQVDAKNKEEHSRKMKQNSLIRKNYRATFIDSASAAKVANRLDYDVKDVVDILVKSTGNWKEIVKFLEQGININKGEVLDLLKVITDKDLRDTPSEILINHLKYSNNCDSNWKKNNYKDYVKYVLNPGVANELIGAYRSTIQNSFTYAQQNKFKADPAKYYDWVKENIKLIDKEKFSRIVISPLGISQTRIADLYSLNVFFVASCRSLGIPARYNRENFVPEYLANGKWNSAQFKQVENKVITKGKLEIFCHEKEIDPIYYRQWSIARYMDGTYQTVGFEWGTTLSSFDKTIELNEGDYLLSTGIRSDNGTVPLTLKFFKISEGKTTNLEMTFKESEKKLDIIGTLDLGNTLKLFRTGELKTTSELTNKKIAAIAWINPDNEPTKHVLSDLKKLKAKYEKWGGTFALLLDKNSVGKGFVPESEKELPGNCVYAYDLDLKLLNNLKKNNPELDTSRQPVVLVIDGDGNYYYHSSGYKIGTGEQLLKTFKQISNK
jgi:transglutaminase-like putative cysteine protease